MLHFVNIFQIMKYLVNFFFKFRSRSGLDVAKFLIEKLRNSRAAELTSLFHVSLVGWWVRCLPTWRAIDSVLPGGDFQCQNARIWQISKQIATHLFVGLFGTFGTVGAFLAILLASMTFWPQNIYAQKCQKIDNMRFCKEPS